MSKIILKALTEATTELIRATKARDEYEVEYEFEKARMLISAEMQGLSSQQQRDAKIIVLLDEKGMYRKMAELKMRARLAWYVWEGLRTITGKE